MTHPFFPPESSISADSGNFTYFVPYLNRPPSVSREQGSLPSISEDLDPEDNEGAEVSTIAAMVGEDLDDEDLGLAVTWSDTVNGLWQYREDVNWTNFPATISDRSALQLSAISMVRFLPNEHFFGQSQFLARIWDMTNSTNQGNAVVRLAGNEGPSGAYSSASATLSVTVTHINDPPVVTLGVSKVTYVESGDPVQIFPLLSIVDVDSSELQSASLVLECPGCADLTPAPGGYDLMMSLDASAGDSILSQSATGLPFRLELIYNDSLRREFEITPLSPSQRDIASFTQYLQSLRFMNSDLEPNPAQRVIFLSVNDGTNSSRVETVTVSIQLVNDEPPFVNLPFDSFTYTENREEVQLFTQITGRPVIVDEDHYNLESAAIELAGGDLGVERIRVDCSPYPQLSCEFSGGNITITGAASMEIYEQILGSLSYENAAEEPDTEPRMVAFSVFDGIFPSPPVSITILTQLINDQLPVVSPANSRVLFREVNPVSPPIPVAANLTVTDLDSGEFPVASIVAVLTDPQDTGDEGVGLPRNLMFPSFVELDDSDPHRVGISVREGSVNMNGDPVVGLRPSLVQEFLRGLRYGNMAEQPSGSNRTITVTVSDNLTLTGIQESAPATITVDFDLVDDSPEVELQADLVVYLEGQVPQKVPVAPNAIVRDVDTPSISGLLLQLTSPPGSNSSLESLRVVLPEDAAITESREISGNLQQVNLTGVASTEVYSLVLRSLTYQHSVTFGDPDSGNRELTVTPVSGDGELGMSDQVTIAFNTVDNPPVLDLNGIGPGQGYTVDYEEESEPVFLTSRDLILRDVDSEELDYVEITLSTGVAATDREAIFIASNILPTGMTVDRNSSDFIRLSGPAPVEEFRTILLALQYLNEEDEPSLDPRNVTVVVSDGNSESQAITVISLRLVNDAPVIFLNGSEVDARVTFVENGPPVRLSYNPWVLDSDSQLVELRIRPENPLPGDVISSADSALLFDEAMGYYFASFLFSPAEVVVQLVSSVTFTNNLPEPAAGDRILCFSVVDEEQLPSSEACSTVSLVFVNDNPPVFQMGLYEASVLENQPYVGVVRVTASDADAFNSNVQLTYDIIAGDDCMETGSSGSGELLVDVASTEDVFTQQPCRFAINESSGQISTTDSPPDREQRAYYLLTVLVSDGMNEGRARVNITILDLNDVAPRFEPAFYNITVPLGAREGFVLAQLSVVDPDENEDIMIFIVTIDPPRQTVFRLEPNGNVVLSVPENQLDPQVPRYTLTFDALDGAFAPSSNMATLEVNVILNNAAPVFDMLAYTATVPESAAVGSLVLRVSATDADTGSNAEITYSIESDSFIPFSINNSTGYITLEFPLDFEIMQSYTFEAVAADGGRIPQSSTVSVSIQVGNVNEDTPTFTEPRYSVSVCEGVPVDYEILRVLAEDGDAGPLGEVTYVIVDSENSNGRIAINETTGSVTVSSPLNFEAGVTSFMIGIQASDGGGRISTEVPIQIDVLNDNEFAPVFVMGTFRVTIPENYPVNSPLPLEVSQSLASDGDACNVDQCNGSAIITNLTCSGYSGLTYSIVDEDNLFAIHPSTGIVSLMNQLDFDLGGHREFALQLVVSDGEFSSTAQLLVTVTDFNDNLPVFIQSNYSVTIPENTPVGESILAVEAIDIDPTSIVIYELAGEGSGDFSINAITGVVSVASPLHFQTLSRYDLTVRATNFAPNDTNSTAVAVSLVILVTDVNDNPPVFSEGSYIFPLQENTQPSLIGMVQATDQDSGSNANLEYSILSITPGNLSLFRIEPSTGAIFSLAVFDREQVEAFLLVVQVRDGGSVPLSASINVSVTILDENDNPPLLTPDRFSVRLDESERIGTLVVTVNAADPDDSEAALLFEIVGGNELGHFSVDNTGAVFVVGELDRETMENYTLRVEVADSADVPLTSTALVYVTLNDINDNAPTFSMGQYSASVPESVSHSYFVIDIDATDADIGSNAAIYYTLLEESSVPFAINMTSGVVTVSRPEEIDYEDRALYSLLVVASNPDGLSSNVTLLITIVDLNDNTPTFTSREFRVSVDEDFTPATTDCSQFVPSGVNSDLLGSGGSGMGGTGSSRRYVTTVTATDRDEANTTNSQIIYSLLSVSPPADFTIDDSTGDIFVSQSLDRECFAAYNLTVEAANAGFAERDTANVLVSVADVNDNSPVFSENLYKVTVFETETSILVVAASDPDSGSNSELRYSLLGGDSSPFRIDPTSGRIYSSISLDREAVPFYRFEVVVRDSGSPSLSAMAAVEVTLEDSNDNPPILTPSNLSLRLDENLPLGTVVATFTITDADIGINALSNLSVSVLDGPAARFAIEGESLVVSGSLDYEMDPQFRLRVIARNVEPPHHSSTASEVVIQLNNLNDNPPVVIFGKSKLEYFERNKRLELDVRPVIMDSDVEILLVEGVIEFVNTDPRDPSIPFAPNTRDPSLPYDCPLEDEKGNKFPPCNIPVQDEHFFTRPDRSLLIRNFDAAEIVSDTFVLDASLEQYAYKSIDSLFTATGLTISTWLWLESYGGASPLTIVSKATSDNVLFSLFCSHDGQNLGFQYRDRSGERQVLFDGVCGRLEGAWNHLGVVLENLTLTECRLLVYVNTELVSAQNISLPIDEPGSVFVGTRPAGGVNAPRRDFFNGRIHLLLFSYYPANRNELNCAIGCGSAIISTLRDTPLDYRYDYNTRNLTFTGRQPGAVYEDFLGSLVLVLPLFEPVSASYSITFMVQDDLFKSIPAVATIELQPVNDFQPSLSIGPCLVTGEPSNFTTTFVEEGGPVPVVNRTDFFLTDGDLVAFMYTITVEILNPEPVGGEILAVTTNIPMGMNVTFADHTLTLSGNLPLPLFAEVLGTITYDNLQDEPTGTFRQLLFTVSDPPEEDITAFAFLAIEFVNDVPILAFQFRTTEYSEGDGPVRFIDSVVIDDSDNTTLVSAQISFNIRDPNMEILSVDTSGTNIAWSYDGAAGLLLLTGEDSLDSYMSVIQSLTYEHTNMEDPSFSTRVFFISVSDGLSNSSEPSPAVMLFFSAVNDPPFFDLRGLERVPFAEDVDSTVAIISPQATLVDVDDSTLANLTITLTPTPDSSETLLVDLPRGETIETESGTELVLNFDPPMSVSTYQAILRSLRYRNLEEELTPGIRVVELSAHDGLDQSLPVSVQVAVQASNDVPALDIDTSSPEPGYQTSFEEQGPSVFITSRNVSISDNDLDARVSTVMVVIQNALDGLDERIVSTNPSVNITSLLSSISASFMITPTDGSLASVENLLTTLQYVNMRNEPTSATRTIAVSVSDGTIFSNVEIVTLRINSVNENPPQFEQSLYSGSVLEEQEPEVSVATVRAVDQDSGSDGEISYSIVSSAPPSGLGMFRIDSSGVLYTTAALDRESVDFYVLNISAADPSFVDYADVQITIRDVNDQAPMFQADISLSILEGSPSGTLIGTLEAFDGDIGTNAEVTFTLGGEGSSSFSLSPSGRVEVLDPDLDADVPNPVVVITVVATDNGTIPLSTTTNFSISILDVNDNPPVFNMTRYSGVLAENSPVGTSILTATATDLDSGSNGRVTYLLRTFSDPPRASFQFAMNESTGVITSLQTFDTEEGGPTAFTFFIIALDNGVPTMFNAMRPFVLITIIDVNDNTPMFSAPSYTQTVSENLPIGNTVVQVSAQDPDPGSNGEITYSIVPNSQVMPLFASVPLFAVDARTGVITVNEVLDFELQSSVSFNVEARDAGSPARSSSAEVTVRIRDLNDNEPRFNQSLYEVSVPETVTTGTIVLTTAAFDADSNENGAVSYSLTDNTNTFAINDETGAIFNVIPLDFETDCFYRLMVTASDGGSPVRNSSAMIYVTVLPVHDVPPVFSPSSYATFIPENLPTGSSIERVSASDGDITTCQELETSVASGSGDSDLLTEEPEEDNFEYVLLNHNNFFAIDSESGLITNLMVPDHEVASQYVLIVQARDPEGLTANASVTVNILDSNDNPPRFTQPEYTTVISENIAVGTTIIQVTATDADSVDEGRLAYSLRDQMQFFTINNQTGEIYVAGSIDFDTLGSFIDLIAIATDTASNSAAAVVTLMITDLNDIPPIIVTSPLLLTFTEGNVSLTPFPQISIVDFDSFQMLCNASVGLSGLRQPNTASSDCTCPDLRDISTCTPGCFEFIQVPAGGFPGEVVKSGNGTMLMLIGNYSIATYAAAIESIQYVNLVSNPIPETRTISVSVSDCQLQSNTLINSIEIQALNVFPPVVDLNGPSEDGNNFTILFRERGPRVAITSTDAVITDEDMIREREELTGLDVWISNPQDGDSESLIVYPNFTHATITLTRASAHSISFSGVALLSEYTDVLRQIFYENRESEPTPAPSRTINVVAHEYHLTSSVSVTTVQFVTSNDHPPVILTSPPRENRVTSFREGAAGTLITASNAFISDMDATEDPVMQLEVHVVSPRPYDALYLSSSVTVPPSISVNIISNSSIVFNGLASPADYDTVIRGLTYEFTGDEFDSLFPPKFLYLEVSDSLRSTFSAVQISLTPVNDQIPVFTESTFTAEIPEDARAGDSVVTVTAVDGDRFSENDISYSFMGGNEDVFFSISAENGTIYLARSVDFERMQTHRLIVTVRDLNFEGTPSTAPSTAVVIVTLRDVNDQVPMFSTNEYNATVGESVPIGTLVLQVFASDGDSEEHSQLEFTLVGTADFEIDRQSGEIATSAEIDRERVQMYTFFVNVRNPGTSAFDTARVTITVLDLDDNPPVLTLEPDTQVLVEPETTIPLSFNLEITDQDPNPSLDYAIVQILTSGNDSNALGKLISLDSSDVITVSGNGTSMLQFSGESVSLDEFASVLRGVIYQDLSPEPVDTERIVAYQVGSDRMFPSQPLQLQDSNGEIISNISLFTVTVTLINDNAPQLSLDTRSQDAREPILSECAGIAGSYSTQYAEDSSPVPVAHSSIEITDIDSGEDVIVYAVAELVNAQDPGLERLSMNLSSSSQVLVSESESSEYRIFLRGVASLQDYEDALRAIM